MLLYALVATKKAKGGRRGGGGGGVPEDLATIENIIFNANQNARGLGVLFNISGRSYGCA